MRNNNASTIQWVIVGSYLLQELRRVYQRTDFGNSQLPTANSQLPTANCQREQTWSWDWTLGGPKTVVSAPDSGPSRQVTAGLV